MREGFSSTDKMTELRRLNDQVNLLEAENARLRKAGEALDLELMMIVHDTQANPIIVRRVREVRRNWREACGNGENDE